MSMTGTADLTTPSPTPAGVAVEARELTKTYGRGDAAVRALNGISFSVPAGTVFGLLGPNGAGKSTATKILTTLSTADSGTALVAGFDVARQDTQVRRSIGYVPQKPSFDPTATGRENLTLQGRIHGMPRAEIRRRGDELLDRFGLADAADRITKTWSGGMQRKLDVALALVHRPAVLFLDEPTTGLDPEARAEMWQEIAALTRADGLTVLLTTHYLEEADRLADHLVIIDRGSIVATGTPEELKASLGGDTVHVELPDAVDHTSAVDAVGAVAGIHDVTVGGGTLRARAANGSATLPGVLAALEARSSTPVSVTVGRPSLDDVYLYYAGRTFAAADDAGKAEAGQ